MIIRKIMVAIACVLGVLLIGWVCMMCLRFGGPQDIVGAVLDGCGAAKRLGSRDGLGAKKT